MPSPLFADRPAPQPPERGARSALDALISQTRRLRGGVDAVRRESGVEDEHSEDPHARWQRVLCELAVHHLDDLGEHLGQLREGLPVDPEEAAPPRERVPAAPPEPERRSLLSRVGSAEWNLLTDEVTWSAELYEIFGRRPADGGLSLDELPSWVHCDDQATLTAMVTDCLVDGKPINGEFRIAGPGDRERTVHMVGEPVLEADGSTGSMWAVLRDVSELRRSQQALHETRDSLQRQRHIAQTEHRLAVELQEAVLPPWRSSLQLPHPEGNTALDLAAHYLPSAISALIGGDWYDALHLPDGRTLLSVGDLTGHGVAATSGMATMLGALRGMAVAGVEPGPLMGFLNQMLDASAQPALGSAVCGLYDSRTRTLTWSQAGHPAPLIFRGGTGWALRPPEGVLLGATSGATYTQRTEVLEPGDVLVLHTDGLAPRSTQASVEAGAERLLSLAPRFSVARTAQECVRTIVEAFGDEQREDDACVLIARIGSHPSPAHR
ncbi:PP2C family protein-serine/threonine phosphatase [Streptomyces zagrosensis]|uniref:Serine phosphatase RsbU (Regulator of sigma subunit) n=1 Tax=Streptomyces zagrosensis TaxID=1042984 RepID=A0A7W9Q835_9ACTN|nr:PP2C family protein-serine/threonine phosphatase [Streptomyces zagrosensis]MBB5935336.1 serine phosphatase RsbU (regulator of sigma subunit) [Streptomyces zagrosensis]